MRPDQLVDAAGELVTHEFVTDYDLDENGQVDPDSIETNSEERLAVVSNPSDEDEQRHEGRLSTGSFRLTVKSDADIRADRGGRRDRIEVRGELTEVLEVRRDRNALTGTEKQTVLVDRIEGHTT